MAALVMDCPRCWSKKKDCPRCDGSGKVNDIQLSPHFKLSEMLESNTARAHGLANDPTPDQLANLTRLCNEVLEPVRALVGPLRVNSGLRTEAVNKAVGGSATSAHCHGLAADLRPAVGTVKALVDAVIRSGLKLDQVIYENPLKPWCHIGMLNPKDGSKRGQHLSMFIVDGEKTYEPFNTNDKRLTA